MTLQLSFACGDYDRTRPLIDGRVKPDGLELNWIVLSPHEIWTRMLDRYEFDASEMSLSSYLISRTLDKPLIAIPVFPARSFRHSFIFVNTKSGISKPKDLEGKRVAQAEFQQTAAVMVRGILQNDYGVDLETIDWFHWYPPRSEITLHKSYKTETLPSAKVAEQMLEKGELDAMICASMPQVFLEGSPHVKRLFDNPKKEEIAYYQKTKIFPIMHTVVIREELWKADPWIATSLTQAFQQAKQIAYDTLNSKSPFKTSLAWLREPLREQREILGDDPWAYGLTKNKHNVEVLMQYLLEQGLVSKTLTAEEVFAPV